MKMDRIAGAILLIIVLLPGIALCSEVDMYQLGTDAANHAMDELGFEKGDVNVLALTNAGYPVINGQTTNLCLDAVTDISGCTPGKENLVDVQSPPWKPLWFGFFDKSTGKAVYMKVNANATGFEVQKTDKIDIDHVLANMDTWEPGVFDHMLPIANMWAHENATYIFMKAVELHDHLCPGISSGFLEAKYVEDKLPITDYNNQSYKVISCPNWCKEDYFLAAWDCTPGKSGMFVKYLTTDETNALKKKYNTSVAGIFVCWNASSNSGDGLVLGFNLDKGFNMSHSDTWPSWAWRLKMDENLMDSANSPEDFVSTIKEFHLESLNDLQVLQRAGINPLKVLGVESS